MRMIKKLGMMTVDLAARADRVDERLRKTQERANDQRDQIVKLQQKVGYLECPKHDYKFDRVLDMNKQFSQMWSRFSLNVLLPDLRYVFICDECKKEIWKTEKELVAVERRSLVTLGLLAKPVVKK
jgi:hypothetical protein